MTHTPENSQNDAHLGARKKEINGSYHCQYHKKSAKCDLCGHIVETRNVFSSHFARKHSVAGHNVHLPASQKLKTKWFIYLEECVHPQGTFQYIGSTDSMTHRWANTKSVIDKLTSNRAAKASTGLEKHFRDGCSQFSGPGLDHVKVTLLEHLDTNEDALRTASHRGGAGCRCSECQRLLNLEYKWICRMGTYNGKYGLNDKTEMNQNTRVKY